MLRRPNGCMGDEFETQGLTISLKILPLILSLLSRISIGKFGRGPRVVVSTAAFHARVRGSFLSPGGLKETKMLLPHPLVKLSMAGNLRVREVACSASDLQGLNFESCDWRTFIHLTILRRFSWPNLSCMCTKVA